MHTHYKGTGKVHSFRGLLEDGKQREINIQGSVGSIAWRITKFEIIQEAPGAQTVESTVKIFRERQPSVTATIDFGDADLLGAAIYHDAGSESNPISYAVIFDNALFVRNIFVTHDTVEGNDSCNYYIELEEVKISTAGMAQLALASTRRTKKY